MSNPQITFDNSIFRRYMNRPASKLGTNNQTWTANMTINGGMFEDNNDDSGYLLQFLGANYNNVRNKILFDDVFMRNSSNIISLLKSSVVENTLIDERLNLLEFLDCNMSENIGTILNHLYPIQTSQLIILKLRIVCF